MPNATRQERDAAVSTLDRMFSSLGTGIVGNERANGLRLAVYGFDDSDEFNAEQCRALSTELLKIADWLDARNAVPSAAPDPTD